MANILLVGIEHAIARKIEQASHQSNHSVAFQPMRSDFAARPTADLIFVSADNDDYLDAVRSIRSHQSPPPVVVVTQSEKTCRWLDALDAGAADYCSAPFDAVPIRWVLDTALHAHR